MDYLTVFSLIPKLALVVLLIIGVAILVEVFSLAKQRKRKEEKKEEIPSELKQAVEPLKFPQEGVGKETVPKLSSRKKMLSLAIISGLVLGLISTLIVVKQKQDIRKEAQETSEEEVIVSLPSIAPLITLTTTSSPEASLFHSLESEESSRSAEIKIYKVSENEWLRLTKEELSLLTAGEEIKVAASPSADFQGAMFKVNGENLKPAPSTTKNSLGEFYVDYLIPENISNFVLEVELLKELE